MGTITWAEIRKLANSRQELARGLLLGFPNPFPMKQILEITHKLEAIKCQLQSEFIGLDEIIEQFIDAVTPWCTLKETQTRPLVVNLWGMTGVGKTTLVRRFLELWDPEEYVLNFNLGSRNDFHYSLKSMENLYLADGKPCVFIFDEFQHARTMKGPNQEMDSSLDRLIWHLLDEGALTYRSQSSHFDDTLKEIIFNMELALERGVKVENGIVEEGVDIIEFINGETAHIYGKFKTRDICYFVTSTAFNTIFQLVRPHYKYSANLKDHLLKLNGQETIDFVKWVEKEYAVNPKLDFSKALIFVIGNLDEAFSLSKSVSSDFSPDLFHEESKKISFPQIKEALKQRFRMEEISRLGNIHLIYPAFNSHFYRVFIANELSQIAERFEKAVGLKIEYATSIQEMIFEEGVVPSQGFRPLKSSIRFLIESSLANMLKQAQFLPREELVLDMEGDDLILLAKGSAKARKRLHLPIRLAKRRKANPETTAVTAVHEAGHALLYSLVYGKLPKSVTISTADQGNYGYMEGERILDVNSYDLVYRDAAVKLAGKKAEELVFKKDYHSTFGCVSDMRSVTKMLVEARRQGVLPDKELVLESKHRGSGNYGRESGADRAWVKEQIKEISELTEQLLKEHQKTLKIFIKVLLEHKKLKTVDLKKALVAEGVNLKELFTSYPPITNYSGQLEEFMNSNMEEGIQKS